MKTQTDPTSRVGKCKPVGALPIGDQKLPSRVETIRAELIRKVAAQTMRWNFRMWGFGESIALRGLLQASRVTGDAEPLGYVKALLRCYVGRGVGRSPEDHVAPGAELLMIYEETGERIFLEAAKKLADLHRGFPQNKQGARLHRSDLQGWRRQIWVDCMDVEAPFLARLGIVTGDERYVTQAAEEITCYARLLQDRETGLFFHGYESDCGNNGCFWARGNGWALMGLVETLKFLPVAHRSRGELLERLVKLCRSLSEYQHEDGLWHTVINHKDTYLESTLAAMAAVALRDAFECGFLNESELGRVERHARAAAIRLIDEDGSLALVSDATPIGNLKMYATRATGVFPWGQGPLLLMLTQL
jgi:unsaturated rhamnogalacturonyl hydrolase